MISVAVGAVLAALAAALIVARILFGSLRVSALPGIFWIMLAGPAYWQAARFVATANPDRDRIAELELELRRIDRTLRDTTEAEADQREYAAQPRWRRTTCVEGHPAVRWRPCGECAREARRADERYADSMAELEMITERVRRALAEFP